MSVLSVKLGVEVISDTKRMWLVHAGHQRRLLKSFEDTQRIFLELPGIGLNDRVLKDEQSLRQRIKYAEALRSAGSLSDGQNTIRIGDFDGSADRAISQAVRTVRHMFSDMQIGDLIVVPTGGAYSPVRFGEIISEFSPDDRIRVDLYDFADVPARRVRWLERDRLKKDMPTDLVALLEKPPAVSELHRSDRTEKLFGYAYESYIKKGEGWSLISAPGYDGNDPQAIIAPHQLIAFCVALYWATEQKADLTGLSFEQIVNRFYTVKDIEDFGVSFASPGLLGFKTRNPKLAMFVTSMVAILGAGLIVASTVAAMPDVKLTTEGQVRVPEIHQTEQQLDYAMKSLGEDVIVQAKEKSDKSRADVDLRADAKVTRRG